MAISIVMPALELAQETGKIISWIKKEGDSIKRGEPLLEIETDKVTFEVEAPGDGILAGVRSAAGEEVPVGQTIAWIVAPGEQPPIEAEPAAPAARAMTAPSRPPAQTSATAAPVPAAEPRAKASPKAKRLAKDLGVDLSKIRGTGPGGTITGEDVEAAAKATTAASISAEPVPLSAIARLMAERTTQSWTTTPHFFLIRDVDATGLITARAEAGPDSITHTDLLIALVARVLPKHPKLNASWKDGRIQLNSSINISLAIAVSDGVVGAVIPNAASASLLDIASLRKELTERARGGHLRPSDVTGGTFTISNLGMYGVDAFNAIITPPQAAVLAVGRIADRVVPLDGKPGIRPVLTLTLSSDHRVVDGAQAALFLNDLAEAIQKPATLL